MLEWIIRVIVAFRNGDCVVVVEHKNKNSRKLNDCLL